MNILKNNRGVAIIIVILMISMIMILTLEFNRSMRAELIASVNSRDAIILDYTAKSGFNFALAVLAEDDPGTDSLLDEWALLNEYSSYSETLFDEGLFQVTATDLKGKIQINRLINSAGEYNEAQKEILLRMLTSDVFGLDQGEAEDLVDNIKDWIDKDDEITGFGVESSWYQGLDPPYSCRNSQMISIEEMLLIKGMTNRILFGDGENPGLSEYLTVFGDEGGRININTADAFVIEMLSDYIDRETAEIIVEYRMDDVNDMSSPLWYKDAVGTGEDLIDQSLLTTKSSFFEIISLGFNENVTTGIRAVVKRDGRNIKTLSWEVF